MLADMATHRGLSVPQFEASIQTRLRGVLPAFAATANPLDTTAVITYDPRLLGRIVEAVLESAEVDGLLIAISTLMGAQADVIASDLVALFEQAGKPVVVGWSLPQTSVQSAVQLLRDSRIPVYDSFGLATAAVAALCPPPIGQP